MLLVTVVLRLSHLFDNLGVEGVEIVADFKAGCTRAAGGFCGFDGGRRHTQQACDFIDTIGGDLFDFVTRADAKGMRHQRNRQLRQAKRARLAVAQALERRRADGQCGKAPLRGFNTVVDTPRRA